MKDLIKATFIVGLIFLLSVSLYAQANFNTSLHKTRAGKNYWYGANTNAPKPGFESLTNVPITHENLDCISCHPADGLDANGDPYPTPYVPGCVDCHATKSGYAVSEDNCYGCHERQATEVNKLGYSDVHRDATNPLKCWDCHKKAELHGDDGVAYNSFLETGAMKTDCSDCHTATAGTLPDHSEYDPHYGRLHCDACHVQSVISCYNCHFESMVQSKIKRPKQPIHDFVILVNREKDGKVGTATFHSLSYQGKAWTAIAPYHAHTITANGRRCPDCHANQGGTIEAIEQYNSTGQIKFAAWNSSDRTLGWLHGVVPLPDDFATSFKMDFLTYDGSTSDPPTLSDNWSYIGKDSWDGFQMFFATPLTKAQMARLGMGDEWDLTYIGEACVICHTWTVSYRETGHRNTINSAYAGAPSYPGNTSPGVPNPPADKTWNDIEYVMGGYGWKALFIDSEGYILTGNANRQYNLANSVLATQANWTDYDAAEAPRKPFTCGRCHTTGWTATGEAGPHQYDLPGIYGTWVQTGNDGVLCEACHGPSAVHSARPSEVKPTKVENCGSCHSFGDVNRIYAKDGLINNRQQFKDHVASPHKNFQCSTCHNPHLSTKYGKGGFKGTDQTCEKCHRDRLMTITAMANLECYDCHMPYLSKSAVSITVNYAGGSVPKGDMRTHIQRIEVDPTWNMFTNDGSYVRLDNQGKAHISIDYVCLTCHTNKDINWAAANGTGIHTVGSGVETAEQDRFNPGVFVLYQNYPNPFNPSTIIRYLVKEACLVALKVYDVNGREVATLVDAFHSPGSYDCVCRTEDLPTGVYFYRIQMKNFMDVKKMVLLE